MKKPIPFEVGLVKVGDHLVHVFDGETIDLLLSQLDTAPDFIAYLKGQAAALDTAHPYSFAEDDLLAASIENWSAGEGLSPHVPPLDAVTPGAWRHYRKSGRGDRSVLLNRQSRSIDRIIEHFHEAFAGGARLPGSSSGSAEHEMALRLVAAESRFARRMIVTALYDILGEEDQSVPWSITIPSPTEAGLRYLWLIYPDPPSDIDPRSVPSAIDYQLRHQTLVTAGEFGADRVVAIALPNNRGRENVVIMRVFDSSRWTEEDRKEARSAKDEALFGEPVQVDHLHVP
jgi:hypothetical protein